MPGKKKESANVSQPSAPVPKPRKQRGKSVRKDGLVPNTHPCQHLVDTKSKELVSAMKERFQTEQVLNATEKQVKALEKKIHTMDAKVVNLFSAMEGIAHPPKARSKTKTMDIL
jgi:hypothetical protein